MQNLLTIMLLLCKKYLLDQATIMHGPLQLSPGDMHQILVSDSLTEIWIRMKVTVTRTKFLTY